VLAPEGNKSGDQLDDDRISEVRELLDERQAEVDEQRKKRRE
jgi:hypothetical protein